MSITDELRAWAYSELSYKTRFDALLAIADRIDAEHAEAQRRWMAELDAAREQSFNAGFDDGFASADDWLAQHEDAMREHGWVKLPKDADGEHIHIGDMLEEVDHDSRGSVGEMRLLGDGWWVFMNGIGRRPDRYRHHKQPTVEDVLEQFAVEVERAGGAFDVADDVWTRFAAKLRLAGEGNE